MAATGKGTLLAREPDENQAGASGAGGGSMPADGRDMGPTTATSDTVRAGGAQAAREGALQQQGEAHRAALMEQAEAAAAKLKGLMAELAGTWVSPLAETEPRVVALAARLVPAAECLETVRENLASTAAQNSAREQMLQAEAHLSFAKVPNSCGGDGRAFKRTGNARGGAAGKGTNGSARLRSNGQRPTSQLDARGPGPDRLHLGRSP
jgi:hypothetical protein